MKNMEKIRRLVGATTPEQLTYVDCAVNDTTGVFMPVAGQCRYAVTPEHTHPAWSFIVAFDNHCRINIGGTVIESVPSEVFVLPPDVPHQELPSETVARYICVLIEPHYLDRQLAEYGKSTGDLRCGMTCTASRRLVDALKEFLSEYEEAAPGYRQLLDAVALTITHLLIRQLLQLSRGSKMLSHRMSITRAIDFLNGHYGERIAVTDLATVANLSPSHFSRVFKEDTGLAPVEYIMRTRLDSAKRMLRGNDKTLSTIALDCGFNSSSYFYQCFTRAFGCSPSEFRKSIRTVENR